MVKVLSPLVQFQQQLRVFHWQTESYAQHKAFGKTYEALEDLIDGFVENFMGKYGKLEAEGGKYDIELHNLKDAKVDSVLNEFLDYLDTFNDELDEKKDTDLLNIRDEIKGVVNTLKYLLTLK
jgi:DNA-binding ferritin-like protein